MKKINDSRIVQWIQQKGGWAKNRDEIKQEWDEEVHKKKLTQLLPPARSASDSQNAADPTAAGDEPDVGAPDSSSWSIYLTLASTAVAVTAVAAGVVLYFRRS